MNQDQINESIVRINRAKIAELQNKCVLVERNPYIEEKYKRMQIDEYHEQIKALRDQINSIINPNSQK
jgi:hypothetical protein